MNDQQVVEIDLLALFRALWRSALAIILAALICGAAAFAYTFFFITPKYEAEATFYVNNSKVTFGSTSFSISSGELQAANTLADTYIEILKSRTTLETVIDEAELTDKTTGRPLLPDVLSKMLTTSTPANGIFRVTVSSTGAVESEKIANTIARVLPQRITDIVEGSSVKIVDYAIVPAKRASPSNVKNTLIGALAGAFIVAAVVCVKEILRSSYDTVIASADDLSAIFPDITILAVIPDMRYSSKKKKKGNAYATAYSANYYKSDPDSESDSENEEREA